jgi:hypothetical protein
MELDVIIDTFSGRENPRWKLSAADARLLGEVIKSLEKCEAPEDGPYLGYKGIEIINCDNTPDFPKKIKAYRSCITILDHDGKSSHLKDDADIEGWLKLESAERGYEILE